MVAITVILAAVIGTFVLGLGDSLSQAPQSQISVQDSSANSQPVNDATNALIEISHDGGDALVDGDYSVQIRKGTSGSYTTLYEGGSGANWTDAADVQVGFTPNPGELTVGDTGTIYVSKTTTGDYDYSGKWDVQIVHKPSDSIIVSRTVTVN